MPLSSLLKRKPKPNPVERRAAAVADDGGPVQAARTQARRRLIGAVVLLALGIVGFPLLFETQPRPVALDTPIELPKKTPVDATAHAPPPELPPETRAQAGLASPPAGRQNDDDMAPAATEPQAPAALAAASGAPLSAEASAPAAPAPVAAKARDDDGDRARALLEGAAASQVQASRYIVQVGAYTDAAALRETRTKVEKMGLKTYTQVVETDSGSRTRVRIGPFATRAEADSAGARLKKAGLPVAVLAL